MKDRRDYVKPTVTKVEVQPDESVMKNCKAAPECLKIFVLGS